MFITKSYLFLLIAYISMHASQGQLKGSCARRCPLIWQPTCAFDGYCYFSSGSLCMLQAENCLRQKTGLPELHIILNGKFCPETVNKCDEIIEDVNLANL